VAELDRLADLKDKLKQLTREGEQQKSIVRQLHEQLREVLDVGEGGEKEKGAAEGAALKTAVDSKSHRFFKEAAEQHIVHVASRQHLAASLFQQLGVNIRRMVKRDVLERWVREVKVRAVEILRKEKLLKQQLVAKPAFREAAAVLMAHWHFLGIESLEKMMTKWKESVSAIWQRRASPYTCTNPGQHISNMHYLNQVHSIVTSSAENQLPVVYKRVLEIACDVADAEVACMFLTDPLSGALSSVAVNVHGVYKQLNRDERIQVFPGDKCVLGLVAQHKCVYLCEDVLQDPHYSPGIDRVGLTGLVVRNLLCLPLFVETSTPGDEDPMVDSGVVMEGRTQPTREGKMVALLYVMNKRSQFGTEFEPQDVSNLFTILQSAPLSIMACQKFIEQGVYVSRLDGLTEMARMDLRTITLGLLSDRLVQLSGAARGTVFCVDEVKEELFFIVDTAAGTKREIRIPLTPKSIAGFAIMEKVTINIPDCYRDPRFNPSTDRATGFKTTQMLCVPLTNHEDKAIGAIQLINSRQGMSFDDNDQKLLEAFAVYVQAAIENLRNAGATQCCWKQVASSITINSLMSNVEPGEDQVKQLFSSFFGHIAEVVGCDYMSVYVPIGSNIAGNKYEGKYLLRDNKGNKDRVVACQNGTMLHAARGHGFMNVCIPEPAIKNNRLELVDVFHGVKGQRQWVEVMPEDVEPAVYQAIGKSETSDKDVHCVADVDFPQALYEETEPKWTNILMVPIPTPDHALVLQVMGKVDAQCFTVADEELLVMVGQMLAMIIPQMSEMMEIEGKLVTKPIIRIIEEKPEFDDDWG